MAKGKLIQFFRGLSSGLSGASLAAGEPGFATDTGKLYIGDGTKKIIINDAASRFATCATAAATVQKDVTVDRFTLTAGEWLFVLFTNTNSAASPTLNVNGLGAKPIYYKNAAITAAYLTNTRVHMFLYDGDQFELVGDVNVDTTYSTLTTALIETGTETTSKLVTAKVLADWLTGRIGLTSGKIVGVGSNGKIDPALLPDLAITNVFESASQTAMLALTGAEQGDVCFRTDTSEVYILVQSPASTLANWKKWTVPVQTSVTGNAGTATKLATAQAIGSNDNATGTVSFDGSGPVNVPIAVTVTAPAASTTQQTAGTVSLRSIMQIVINNIASLFSTKANLASPALTGTPTAPTAAAGTNTTQIATTAFVQTVAGDIDGGTW